MMYSVNLKKAEQSKLPVEIRFACLRQAQAPRPPALRGESFDPEITADGRVTGCCSLVIKSIKRSLRLVGVVAPTPRRASSIFNVQSDLGVQGLPLITSDSIFTTGSRSLMIRVFVGLKGVRLPSGERNGFKTEARYSASACSSRIIQTTMRPPGVSPLSDRGAPGRTSSKNSTNAKVRSAGRIIPMSLTLEMPVKYLVVHLNKP